VLEDGTLFWSDPKQCPEPLEFDASQDTHLLYVLAAANLYARMHGLPGSRDQTALRELLKLLPLPGPQPSAPSFPNDLDRAGASAEFGEVPGSGPPSALQRPGPVLSLCHRRKMGPWGPAANSVSQVL